MTDHYKLKTYEVYDEFALWMIGEKVEVGIYENGPDPEEKEADAKFIGRTAGVLQEYAVPEKDFAQGTLLWRFVGADRGESIPNGENYHILISVLEKVTR